MYSYIFDTPSSFIFSGVSATLYNSLVSSLTFLSVDWALNTTATSRVKAFV